MCSGRRMAGSSLDWMGISPSKRAIVERVPRNQIPFTTTIFKASVDYFSFDDSSKLQ